MPRAQPGLDPGAALSHLDPWPCSWVGKENIPGTTRSQGELLLSQAPGLWEHSWDHQGHPKSPPELLLQGRQAGDSREGDGPSCPTLMLFLGAFPQIWDYGTTPEAPPIQGATTPNPPPLTSAVLGLFCFKTTITKPLNFNIFRESCN